MLTKTQSKDDMQQVQFVVRGDKEGRKDGGTGGARKGRKHERKEGTGGEKVKREEREDIWKEGWRM